MAATVVNGLPDEWHESALIAHADKLDIATL
jgi:hypothetical protein